MTIVDVGTGEVLSTLDSFVDREFAWTSPTTIVTVIFGARRFLLIEFEVDPGQTTTIAAVRYPWVYVAAGV